MEHLALTDVKKRLSEVIDGVEREHGRVVITRHGRPAAVVLSIDDLESLEETLSVLSSQPLMKDIRAGIAELDAGKGVTLTKEEALAHLRSE